MRQIVLLLRRHRFAFRFLRRGGDERIFRAVERIAEIYRSCRATIEAGDGRRWPLLLGRRSSIGKTPSLNFFQSRRVKYRINASAVARAPINSTERRWLEMEKPVPRSVLLRVLGSSRTYLLARLSPYHDAKWKQEIKKKKKNANRCKAQCSLHLRILLFLRQLLCGDVYLQIIISSDNFNVSLN